MKKIFLLALLSSFATEAFAKEDAWNNYVALFSKGDTTATNAYRIPAITATSQGTIISVADFRHRGSGDIGTDSGRQKVDFAIKVSQDGGNTWTEKSLLSPDNNLGISDPAIVHNSDTGKTFLFGYQNTVFIPYKNGNFDFFMYSSNDGGLTWDKGQSLKHLLPKGYKYLLQGPGGGMYHNGMIYVPIQAWHHEKDRDTTATSGFMYSSDNGKTWKTSLLRPEWLPSGKGIDISSESNVFHHKGKIYLAVKPETSREKKKRMLFSTADNGKTWERVEESFIPDDVAQCESSSLALNDDVYLVSYTKDKPSRRQGIFVSTNTGKQIQIFEPQSMGYTSMAQDADNLYVLFEGFNNTGDILFRKFDISAKEYANVNAQILKRGSRLLTLQNRFFATTPYVSGAYGSNNANTIETMLLHNNYKIGAFHEKTRKNSDDVYRTIDYDTETSTLILSQDNVITRNDNIFLGYEYTKLDYTNKSKNSINSFIAGYSLKHELENNYIYTMGINGVYSNNKLKRNKEEGLGKTASFDTYSLSLQNMITKPIITKSFDWNVSGGLNTSVFGHGEIKEKDGNGFNDAIVSKSKNISNEIFANVQVNKSLKFNENFSVKLGTNVMYKKELMNVDSWRDKFTVLDVKKEFATPVKNSKAGVGVAEIFAEFDINNKVEVKISHEVNSLGKNSSTGKLTYKF